MRVRHVEQPTQLRFGERLIVRTPSFAQTAIRLPEWSALAVGVVSHVVVYGPGYVRLLPPPNMQINNRSLAVYVTEWNPAMVVLNDQDGYGCHQSGYQTTWSQWNHVDKAVTTAGAFIFATGTTVRRYPGEYLFVHYDATMSVNNPAHIDISLYNETTTSLIGMYPYSLTIGDDLKGTVSFQQNVSEANVPVGNNVLNIWAAPTANTLTSVGQYLSITRQSGDSTTNWITS
jgi:hypothetical protein